MQVITPTTVTAAMYTSGPAEADYAAYVAGTTYAAGDYVIRTSTHRIYQSLQASNIGHTPESSPTWWNDIAPTNKWAMLDNVVGTATTLTSPLAVVLAPGLVNALALLELVGESVTVSMTSASAGGATVYSTAVNLDDSGILDYYDYFFYPFIQRSVVVLTDLPPYADGVITVTLTGAGTVAIGVLVVGLTTDLGGAQYGASIGFNDYSVKSTDQYGRTSLIEGAYSRRSQIPLSVAKPTFNRMDRKLTDLRATHCVWVGTDDPEVSPFVIFGWVKQFQTVITYSNMFYCNLEIEGLT